MHSIFQMVFFTGLVLILEEKAVHAQFQSSRYEFGINAGTMIYQGDLTPRRAGDYTSLKPALGLSVSRMLGQHLAIAAQLHFGKLTTDESRYMEPQWRQDRSFSFSTNLTELSGLLVWNMSKTTEYRQPRFTPYIFAGAGITVLHIRKDWSKVNTAVYGEGSQVQIGLALDTLQSGHKVIPVLPLGAGIRYRFTQQWSFNIGVNYRLVASDYIDGFKYSGNAGKKDGYYGASVGVLYSFGSYKCPPVK